MSYPRLLEFLYRKLSENIIPNLHYQPISVWVDYGVQRSAAYKTKPQSAKKIRTEGIDVDYFSEM